MLSLIAGQQDDTFYDTFMNFKSGFLVGCQSKASVTCKSPIIAQLSK